MGWITQISRASVQTAARRPKLGVILRTAGAYAPPNTAPIVGELVSAHGRFASQAAATEARMPFIFRRFLGRPPFSLGPPPPPFPGPLGGIAPLLNRDPVQDVRLRRFTEILSSMYNSLSRRGYVRQDSPGQWSLQTGAFQAMRAPGVNDDETANVLPGMTWINTATGEVYINVSNAVGAADWMQVGGGGGSGLSGVFP